jgi:hypothetical protein
MKIEHRGFNEPLEQVNRRACPENDGEVFSNGESDYICRIVYAKWTWVALNTGGDFWSSEDYPLPDTFHECDAELVLTRKGA